ncbi:hypothetical protein TVAG_140510 [Trichomonas vaginalis G3]|uniref:Uncharacterized protein n=1 Tax=Trichomonas vaginalis (strain ATCC PRA-98 / G3) TaxID=412133 RepID=A2EJT9_TRIV3|nr:1-phosphatidylinositol-3-kinase protein [Trichomonas vaginalis G3]EAY07077.1 hypothetical protein TVAG_140510 [Trichomonas vaginalis G3]KAI5535252.1 1-phosphatidylinositol-3-kinase protein [Trichomonas vaginalis G3]|eukprot:XP_001319300.1 hypothetical protein [Trichomonas vaginalis G3]
MLIFNSLLSPISPPDLSSQTEFARIVIFPPQSAHPSTIFRQENLMLSPKSNNSSLNPCQRLYHDPAHSQGPAKSSFLKELNVTETLNKIKAISPLMELLTIQKKAFI